MVPMDGVGRECRNANRHIFSTIRRAVANPLAFMRDDRLACFDVCDSALVLDPHHAFEHYGVFVEIRTLTGLGPPSRTAHVRDAGLRVARIHAADVFVDDFVSRNWNGCGRCNQLRHLLIS